MRVCNKVFARAACSGVSKPGSTRENHGAGIGAAAPQHSTCSALHSATQCSCLGWKLLRSQGWPAWFWDLLAKEKRGWIPLSLYPQLHLMPSGEQVFQSLSPSEAEEAANKYPGTEALGTDCCYGWGQQTSSTLNIHPISQCEVSTVLKIQAGVGITRVGAPGPGKEPSMTLKHPWEMESKMQSCSSHVAPASPWHSLAQEMQPPVLFSAPHPPEHPSSAPGFICRRRAGGGSPGSLSQHPARPARGIFGCEEPAAASHCGSDFKGSPDEDVGGRQSKQTP